mgnify:CR=1 FL=1
MNGISFSLEDFQNAAAQFRDEILLLPVVGLDETLKEMTIRPGVHGIEYVGTISTDGELGNYNSSRVDTDDAKLEVRALQTYLGSVIKEFEPNKVANTVLGRQAALTGDAQKDAISAKLVLASLMKSTSRNLNDVIWSAAYSVSGTKSATLFNGFDTITAAEITAGNIATSKGNLYEFSEALTVQNVIAKLKALYKAASPVLKATECNIYCDPDILALYNDAYLASHNGTPYNQQFEQTVLEGTSGKWKFVALSNKAGSGYITVSPKENLLIGYDNEGGDTYLQVDRFKPFVLTFSAAMFFGVQFESIQKERLLIGKLYVEEESSSSSQQAEESSSSSQQAEETSQQ